jgi:hypothetical protein
MRNYREYTTIDKGEWGPGAWQGEPDKVQWVDAATGLDCLMVRNPGGAWCGYVGVGPGHPWHGTDYSGCIRDPKCEESWCGHSPEGSIDVHGGLTYADSCQEPTEDRWREHAAKAEDAGIIAEAAKYPQGDAARRLASLREQAALTYEEWVEHVQARAICHVPEPGRPDDVWWFGFDCAHAWDFSPGYAELGWDFHTGDETYRDRAYAEGYVGSLAKQLAGIVR